MVDCNLNCKDNKDGKKYIPGTAKCIANQETLNTANTYNLMQNDTMKLKRNEYFKLILMIVLLVSLLASIFFLR